MARRKRKPVGTSTRPLFGPIFCCLLCLFAWAALLTYQVADWPNPSHFPHNDPVHNACGRAGAWAAYQLLYWLGEGAWPLVLFGTLASGLWLVHGTIIKLLQRMFGLMVLVACMSVSAAMILDGGRSALSVGPGGVLGTGLAGMLVDAFARWGTYLVLLFSFVVGLLFTAEGWVLRLPSAMKRLGALSADALAQARATLASPPIEPATASNGPRINPGRSARPRAAEEAVEDASDAKSAARSSAATGRSSRVADDPAEGDDPTEVVDEVDDDAEAMADDRSEAADDAAPAQPAAGSVAVLPRKPEPPPKAYPTPITNWTFPPLKLLRNPESSFSAQQESLVRAKARLLEQTLEEFRLDARVVEIDTGPVITMFELSLGAGIKVSQVSSLANDVARALKAPAVRVVAPIPGKNTVGIEVPNTEKEKVRLKELITIGEQKAGKMALPLFLGKDASGAVLLADLAAMPHMLIAGTTGSGKSVCINSIIASILMVRKPDEVKLILVDPKMVEMSQFKDVPHLMSPIVTDMNRAEQILDWAVTKMEERYELLAEARVRNITTYNKLGPEEIERRFKPTTPEEKTQIPVKLPYIIVVIDELADLMMTAAKEVEHHLARLAQKSRAVGIHIVVATQRPEAKVVTGLIKSNMPCRVAFRVASRMDSRIVLDQNGAEVLMGQGDMLFLPPGSHKLIRAQGTLLEDDELGRMIGFLTERARPEFHPQLVKLKHKGLEGDGNRDPLFEQAVRVVLESQRGSVSLLQRRLSVGYSRASRLVDEIAEAGIVGEFKGSQAREVLMTLEEWDAHLASVNREIAEGGYAADQDDAVVAQVRTEGEKPMDEMTLENAAPENVPAGTAAVADHEEAMDESSANASDEQPSAKYDEDEEDYDYDYDEGEDDEDEEEEDDEEEDDEEEDDEDFEDDDFEDDEEDDEEEDEEDLDDESFEEDDDEEYDDEEEEEDEPFDGEEVDEDDYEEDEEGEEDEEDEEDEEEDDEEEYEEEDDEEEDEDR